MRNTTLNDKQSAVLKWVCDGCVDGVYQGTSHRLVARALHHRKLIVVKGNGPSWSARITDEGTHYLEHGERPPTDNHRPQTVNRPSAARKAAVPGVIVLRRRGSTDQSTS